MVHSFLYGDLNVMHRIEESTDVEQIQTLIPGDMHCQNAGSEVGVSSWKCDGCKSCRQAVWYMRSL